MEKIYNIIMNNGASKNQFADGEEVNSFDEVMEKITNGMFKVIIYGGIPYFVWVFFQFVFIK
jgi:hypothetical protein